MFNSTAIVSNHNHVHTSVKHEAQSQSLEIRTEHTDSFIVKCKIDDNVWNGLFYERPFLNRYLTTKANCLPISFCGSQPETYSNDEYATFEQNARWKQQYNDRVTRLIKEQAVVVHQVKLLDKTGIALIEVSWVK